MLNYQGTKSQAQQYSDMIIIHVDRDNADGRAEGLDALIWILGELLRPTSCSIYKIGAEVIDGWQLGGRHS